MYCMLNKTKKHKQKDTDLQFFGSFTVSKAMWRSYITSINDWRGKFILIGGAETVKEPLFPQNIVSYTVSKTINY